MAATDGFRAVLAEDGGWSRTRRSSGRPADLSPGLRMEVVERGPLLDRAEEFVYDVYRQVGYCRTSSRKRVEELQLWSDRSVFHVVADEADVVVGTVRTVVGQYDELPIGQFLRNDFRHPDPVCELGALAVEASSRSTGVIEHLYRAGWLQAARSGSSALVAVIEPWLLEVFISSYGLAFEQIGEGMDYLGGYSVPTAFPLVPRSYEILTERNPGFMRWNGEAATVEELIKWGIPILLTDAVPAESGARQPTEVPTPGRHRT